MTKWHVGSVTELLLQSFLYLFIFWEYVTITLIFNYTVKPFRRNRWFWLVFVWDIGSLRWSSIYVNTYKYRDDKYYRVSTFDRFMGSYLLIIIYHPISASSYNVLLLLTCCWWTLLYLLRTFTITHFIWSVSLYMVSKDLKEGNIGNQVPLGSGFLYGLSRQIIHQSRFFEV